MSSHEVAVRDSQRLATNFLVIPLIILWLMATAYLTGIGEVFLAVGINLGAGLIILWFINARTVLGILLIVRILLDAFHENLSFSIAGIKSLSLPALSGIYLALFGTLYLVQNYHTLHTRLVVPIAVFLLAAGVSTLLAYNFELSIVELLELYSYFVLFFITVHIIRDEPQLKSFALLIILSSLVPLLIGSIEIIQHGRFVEIGLEPSFRAKSTLTHPTAYGFYLLVVSCLLLSLYSTIKSAGYRLSMVLLLLLITLNVVFTFTRGVWLAFVTAVLVFSFLRYKKMLLLLPVLFYAIFQTIPYVYERIEPLFNSHQYKYTSFAWRTKLWSSSIPFFYDSPVFGSGIGNYELISKQIEGHYMAAHNDYIRLLIETGLVGTVSFVAILILLLATGWQALRHATTNFEKSLAAGFISLMIAYIVLSLTDNLFNNGAMQWYFWTFAAMAVASARISRWRKEGLLNQ